MGLCCGGKKEKDHVPAKDGGKAPGKVTTNKKASKDDKKEGKVEKAVIAKQKSDPPLEKPDVVVKVDDQMTQDPEPAPASPIPIPIPEPPPKEPEYDPVLDAEQREELQEREDWEQVLNHSGDVDKSKFQVNEDKMVLVAEKVIIKSLNKEAAQDNTTGFVQAYIKSGNLTKDDRDLVVEGGPDVTDQFLGWIQKVGEIAPTDLAITGPGDCASTNQNLQYIFHLNVPEGSDEEQINSLGPSLVKVLETANVLGVTSISIPTLVSEETLKSASRNYFKELVRVLECWIDYKLEKGECYLEEVNVCCPVVVHHKMLQMIFTNNYKQDEDED